jgi:hypothetical protein
MRPNQNKRMRGRSSNNNRRGPNPLTRTYESNGPDAKVRGTAAHVAEKYVQLARDAHVASDPVAAENYLQHAEHYYRIIATAQALQTAQQQQAAGLPVTVEIDEADEEDFDNAMSDRFTYRAPQSFQPQDQNGVQNGQPGVNQPYSPREGGEMREPRDGRQDNRNDIRNDNRNDNRQDGRNDHQPREPRRFEGRDGRGDFRRDNNRDTNRGDRNEYRRERPEFGAEQPGYAPDQPDSGEPREAQPGQEGADRPRNDRFNRRDRFREPRGNRPPREGNDQRFDRPERSERTEQFERNPVESAPTPDSDVGLPSFITQPKRLISDESAAPPAEAAAKAAPKRRGRKPKATEEAAAED